MPDGFIDFVVNIGPATSFILNFSREIAVLVFCLPKQNLQQGNAALWHNLVLVTRPSKHILLAIENTGSLGTLLLPFKNYFLAKKHRQMSFFEKAMQMQEKFLKIRKVENPNKAAGLVIE
ncbi:hypothetical protein SLE2022_183690 [Rubroshorea leprosula]